MSWCLHMVTCHVENCRVPYSLGQSWKGIVVAASGYAVALLWKWWVPSTAGQLFNTHSTDVWNPEKRPAVSLYLDELSIQKCKFRRKKGEARHSGTLFNKTTIDRWNHERRPSVSLYLDELPIQKCQFRDRFNVSIFSLERLSPRGSCHLDESSMNHTLAQKYLIELLMWNASYVQKTFQLNLTGDIDWSEVRNCVRKIFLCPC